MGPVVSGASSTAVMQRVLIRRANPPVGVAGDAGS